MGIIYQFCNRILIHAQGGSKKFVKRLGRLTQVNFLSLSRTLLVYAIKPDLSTYKPVFSAFWNPSAGGFK